MTSRGLHGNAGERAKPQVSRPSDGPAEPAVLRGRWLTTRTEARRIEFTVRWNALPFWVRQFLPGLAEAYVWMRTSIAMRGARVAK